MFATAADIPIELHDLIFDFFVIEADYKDTIVFYRRNFVKATVRDLGHCALVCHAWTPVFQRVIFNTITFRSRQHFLDFVALASHPQSCISGYVYGAHVVQRGEFGGVPWLYLLSQKLHSPSFCDERAHSGPFLPGLTSRSRRGKRTFTVEFIGPCLPADLKGGIYGTLPMRLPPLFTKGLRILILTKLKFRSLRDVVDLAKDLSSLQEMFCQDLSWACLPNDESGWNRIVPMRSEVPYHRLKCFMYDSEEVQFGREDHSWAIVLVQFGLYGRVKLKLPKAEFNTLASIVCCLVTGVDTTRWPRYRVATHHEGCGDGSSAVGQCSLFFCVQF